MFKRKSLVLLIVVVALIGALAAPLAASADTIWGRGTLIAEGRGTVVVRGAGHATLSGKGTLYFKDNAGDAQINISTANAQRDPSGGWLIWRGFDGTFEVRGTGFTLRFAGAGIHLEATGAGVATLRGHGWYEVNGHHGNWAARGATTINLSEA